MPDWQNRGGRWLQRTADRGPDCPEPEWQYIPPEAHEAPGNCEPEGIIVFADVPRGAEPSWPGPDLPDGRVLLHIDDGSGTALPIKDDWTVPDWTAGASLSDFVRHLSPDTWRRLESSRDPVSFGFPSRNKDIECDQTGENLGELSDHLRDYLDVLRTRWSELDDEGRSRRTRDFVTHLVLEKTKLGQEFCLKYLRHTLDSDWEPLPQAWRDKLRRLGTLKNPGAPGRCLDPDRSTLEFHDEIYELAIFKSASESATQPAIIQAINRNRGGRPPKYDWEGLHNEITRIALIEGELPERLELHRRMIEWCARNWREQPEGSEIRKRIARLYGTPGILP